MTAIALAPALSSARRCAKQIGRRLDRVAERGQVQHGLGARRVRRRYRTKRKQCFAGLGALGIEAQPRARRVMGRQHARR